MKGISTRGKNMYGVMNNAGKWSPLCIVYKNHTLMVYQPELKKDGTYKVRTQKKVAAWKTSIDAA